MDEKLALLAKVPLFAGLGPKDIEEVGRLADEITVAEGKVLAKEGAAGEEFFVILDGTIEISRGGDKIRDLGAGQFFGELALLGNVPVAPRPRAPRVQHVDDGSAAYPGADPQGHRGLDRDPDARSRLLIRRCRGRCRPRWSARGPVRCGPPPPSD